MATLRIIKECYTSCHEELKNSILSLRGVTTQFLAPCENEYSLPEQAWIMLDPYKIIPWKYLQCTLNSIPFLHYNSMEVSKCPCCLNEDKN